MNGVVGNCINKYRSLSLPVKSSVWFMICSFIQKGITFLTTPIFTRIMTQQEYGIVSLYGSWLGIITIFATLNLPAGSYGKAMLKYEDDRNGYTSSVMMLAIICESVIFCIYYVTRGFWGKLLGIGTEFIILMFLDLLLSISISFYSTRKRFDYHYKEVVAITLTQSILGIVLSVVLVLHSNEDQAFLKISGTLFAHALLSIPLYFKIIKKGGCLYNRKYWNYAFKFNVALIPHYLSQKILTQVDWIMIGKICGSVYTALYSVAYQLANAMNLVVGAVDSAFSPWALVSIKENKHKNIAKVITLIIFVFGFICFVFSLFAPELIWVLGGDSYMEAVWAIPPVAMSTVFNMMYSLIANYAFYFEKKRFIVIGSCFAAFLNLILNAVFIPKFGFVAAGYTTLACYIAYAMAHYCFAIKICAENGINNPFNGKLLWAIAFSFVGLSIVDIVLYFNTLIRYLVLLIMTLVLVFLYLFLNRKKKISLLEEINKYLR